MIVRQQIVDRPFAYRYVMPVIVKCARICYACSAGETMVSDRGLERDSEKKNVKNRRKSRMTEKSEGARSIERCESMSRERKDRI